MSDMYITTGNVRHATCRTCGKLVTERESTAWGNPKRGTAWSAEHHDAPCGRPCMGAGVLPRDVRARFPEAKPWTEAVHGWKHGDVRTCPEGCEVPQ